MTTLYKKYFYLLSFLFSLTAFGQTILIENREENDSLWSLGASDLLSFYLEEQGLNMANRDSLSKMTGEVDLAEAKFSKSSIQKGQWNKTDFIITGEVNAVPDKGLFIQVSVIDVKNGQVITKQQKQVKDEDQLAVEIEVFARLIGKKIASDANRKLNNEVKETQEQFLDAITLFKFYKAINLITDDNEAEGIRELIYITHNSPNFKLPYYWLANFFKKYNYLKIAESIESVHPSLLNTNKSVYLIYGQSLANNIVQKTQNEIEKMGFYTLDPKSLLKLDLEKDLQQWRYLKSGQIAQLSSYLSAYTIKLDLDKEQKYYLKISESQSNKLITEFISSDFSKVIEILNTLNDPSKIKKLNNQTSENKPKITSYTKSNQHEYLAYLIQQLMDKEGSSEDIWRLMSFYRTKHLRGHLWPEILSRSSKEKISIWELTHKYQIKNNEGLIGSPINSFFSSPNIEFSLDLSTFSLKHQDLLKSLKPYKNNTLQTQYAYIYNLAIEQIRNKKYHEGLQQLNNLNSTHFKKLSLPDTITYSINYWKWLCAFKLKNNKLREQYSTHVQTGGDIYTGIIPFVRNGHVKQPGIDWQACDITYIWRAFKDSSVTVLPFGQMDWPEIPLDAELKHSKNLYKFFDVFEHKAQIGDIPRRKLGDFYYALYGLDALPNAEINDKIKSLCYKYKHLFKPSDYLINIMCIIGDYKTAEEIIKNSNYPVSAKVRWWVKVWRYNYDKKEVIRKAANYMIFSGKTFIIHRDLIESCFRYKLFNEVEKLIDICEKVKPISEEMEATIAIHRANLAFHRGNMLKALQMHKKLRLSRWSNSINGEINKQEVKDYLLRQIRFIESLDPNRVYTRTWEQFKTFKISTEFVRATSTVAFDVFTSEVRKDFTEIMYTIRSLKCNQGVWNKYQTEKKIQDHLKRFVNKHTAQVLPQFIRYLDYPIHRVNKQVAEWLIEKMASQENKEIILDSFKKNQDLANLAFKLDRIEAIKIFENNIWVTLPRISFYPHLYTFIIDNHLTKYYPHLYDLCYSFDTEAQNIIYLFNKAQKNSAPNDYQEYQKFLNKMIFEVCPKMDLKHSGQSIIYRAVMFSAFTHGNTEGLKLLIQLLDKKINNNNALLPPKYLFKFFQKVTKHKVKSVQEIQEIMSTLKWNQDKRKWTK